MDLEHKIHDKASQDNQCKTEAPEMIGDIMARMLASGELPALNVALAEPRGDTRARKRPRTRRRAIRARRLVIAGAALVKCRLV